MFKIKGQKMKIIVTGANGFVGRSVVTEAVKNCHEVLAITRGGNIFNGEHTEVSLADFLLNPMMSKDYDVLIHAAGLAHGKQSNSQISEIEDMYSTNVKLTVDLAEAVFRYSNVRFILLSSLAVYGLSSSETMINEKSELKPNTVYGKSKLEAERNLAVLASIYDKEYTIIRPPLVYGHGAPANFGLLARLAHMPIPLPFATATAERSMVGVKNLAAFLLFISSNESSARKTYMIADNETRSLRNLVILLRKGNSKLISFPINAMTSLLKIVGKEKMANQLFSPLIVDLKSIQDLGWNERYSFDDNMSL